MAGEDSRCSRRRSWRHAVYAGGEVGRRYSHQGQTTAPLGRGDYLQLECDTAPKRGNDAPNRQEFQRDQLTELGNTDFDAWAKESYEIATKIAYRNDGRIGIPRGGNMDCTMVAAAPVLPGSYVVSARRIADRRMILTGYRLADLLTRVLGN